MVIDAGASTRVQDYRGETCCPFAGELVGHILMYQIFTAICFLLYLPTFHTLRFVSSPGNTVLHVLVLQPNKTIACQAIDLILARDAELDQSVPLDMVPNYRGLTPFKLAAKEGNVVVRETRRHICVQRENLYLMRGGADYYTDLSSEFCIFLLSQAFQHLVNKRRVVQWRFGPLTSNLYDLTEIDSWADDMSVLELIVGSNHREVQCSVHYRTDCVYRYAPKL